MARVTEPGRSGLGKGSCGAWDDGGGRCGLRSSGSPDAPVRGGFPTLVRPPCPRQRCQSANESVCQGLRGGIRTRGRKEGRRHDDSHQARVPVACPAGRRHDRRGTRARRVLRGDPAERTARPRGRLRRGDQGPNGPACSSPFRTSAVTTPRPATSRSSSTWRRTPSTCPTRSGAPAPCTSGRARSTPTSISARSARRRDRQRRPYLRHSAAAARPARRPALNADRSYAVSKQRGLLDRLGDLFSDNPDSEQAVQQLAAQRIGEAAKESELTGRAETNTTAMLKGLLGSPRLQGGRRSPTAPDQLPSGPRQGGAEQGGAHQHPGPRSRRRGLDCRRLEGQRTASAGRAAPGRVTATAARTRGQQR